MESVACPTTSLGGILGRSGTYFLKRRAGERAVFSFDNYIICTTRAPIMGQKPPVGTYQPHATDSGGIEAADELSLEDFAQVVTGQEECTIPPTVSRGTAATMVTNFTIPPMAMEALGELATQRLLRTRGYDANVDEDMFEGLDALQLDDMGTVTRAVMGTVTRGLTEAADQIRSMPMPTPHIETEPVTGGHKEVTEPSRTPETPAPPDAQAATPKAQPIPKHRNPFVMETARLLKDHVCVMGR